MREYVGVTKSAQRVRNLIFGVMVVVDGGSPKMSKWCVCDLDYDL